MLHETNQNGGVAAARRGPRAGSGRLTKVTVDLGGGRSVVVSSPGLTMNGFIELLEETITKARKARGLNMEINTFRSLLLDQSRAAPTTGGL